LCRLFPALIGTEVRCAPAAAGTILCVPVVRPSRSVVVGTLDKEVFMKRLLAPPAVSALLLALCVLSVCPAPARAQDGGGAIVLENKHVLIMVAAKVAPEVILEKIRSSPCNFDTFPPVLAELKSRGVPDSVLLAMVRAPHGPSGAEQDARGEVTLHPVSEVMKYSGNYAKTREGVQPSSTRRPSARSTLNTRRRS
jgi:hypothetical protein